MRPGSEGHLIKINITASSVVDDGWPPPRSADLVEATGLEVKGGFGLKDLHMSNGGILKGSEYGPVAGQESRQFPGARRKKRRRKQKDGGGGARGTEEGRGPEQWKSLASLALDQGNREPTISKINTTKAIESLSFSKIANVSVLSNDTLMPRQH